MSRQLPARPNLDHLKAQAKDLLDAHRRREPEAFARIRAHVPAFATMSDDALARAGSALHDAQSAIAREYGFASWAELRDQLAAMAEPPAASDVAARLAAAQQFVATAGLPAELVGSVREAISRRGAAAGLPTPERVPVLPLRNAVAFPGAVIPLDIQRPTTLRAVDAARAHTPALLAIFAQHAAERPSSRRRPSCTPPVACAACSTTSRATPDPLRSSSKACAGSGSRRSSRPIRTTWRAWLTLRSIPRMTINATSSPRSRTACATPLARSPAR
jgi:hypothetical protein